MDATPADSLFCPQCGQPIELTAIPADGIVQCPACDAQFFLSADDSSEDDRAIRELESRQAEREQELSHLRSRQIATERRAIMRLRSYHIVAMLAAIVLAIQLFWLTWKYARSAHWLWAAAAAMTGIALSLGALYWRGRASAISAELAKPLLEDPRTPPDFSTLSDGSQQWKNLEEIR